MHDHSLVTILQTTVSKGRKGREKERERLKEKEEEKEWEKKVSATEARTGRARGKLRTLVAGIVHWWMVLYAVWLKQSGTTLYLLKNVLIKTL